MCYVILFIFYFVKNLNENRNVYLKIVQDKTNRFLRLVIIV